ncbi:PREDICTED: protein LURP-one-related 14-like [Camelina sativa]|uniref:Protein LURP-one-related 14-like n=1 Tax=Camelina sativa TaxID=90675 RepID=A0ABM0XUQ2_CAMSA|nr:PREDICTED: protein LURP-one-related 14-like [Camelina sativa]
MDPYGPYQQMNNGYAYGVPVAAAQNTNVVVVSDVFCCPYPLELTVKKNCKGLSGAKLEVVDIKSNVVLRVDGPHDSFNKKRVLRDPAGYPLLTMREKLTSLNHRWTVHRGEGSDPTELMFTVQRSHPFQWRARLDVSFQSNNQVRNFSVVGTYFDDSAKVYQADTLVAEVKEKSTFGGYFKGKQDFVVRISAGVDYAFVVSLLIILTETNSFF